MHFFLALDGGAGVVGGVHHFGGKALGHGLFTALAAEFHQPAQGQRLAALRADLDRHLVGGAAHAAGLDLQLGRHVAKGGGKHLSGVLAGLFLDGVKRGIADALRGAALAVQHDLVDELGDHGGPVNGIGQHLALGNKSTTGHLISSFVVAIASPQCACGTA